MNELLQHTGLHDHAGDDKVAARAPDNERPFSVEPLPGILSETEAAHLVEADHAPYRFLTIVAAGKHDRCRVEFEPSEKRLAARLPPLDGI
ncbi:MAG: hypothetical protein H0X39_02500 [Actinobacteria bacterium]|nr:hypothetical protein [Actinomycetota bacterium]